MEVEKNKMSGEDERMIPVFTVLKSGAVLKNIFVVNKPPDESNMESQETEEILIVGRHPDCNVVLMHPSISRFHLQINSNPFSRKLFVTDLASVHGTWVSEKKVEPGFRMEVNEGDTIRLGGSTRVYRLHWVPLGCAYDTEKPFVSPSDLAVVKEEEEQCGEVAEGERELESFQDLNLVSAENGEIQSSDLILEDISSMFPEENWGLILDKEVQSAPFDPECRDGSINADQEEVNSPSRINDEVRKILSLRTVEGVVWESKDQQFEGHNHSPRHDFVREAMPGRENKDVLMIQSDEESDDALWFDSLLSSEDAEEHNHNPHQDSVRKSMPGRENMDVLIIQSEKESSGAVCVDSSIFPEDAEEHAANEAPEETQNKVLFAEKQEEVNNFPLGMESLEIPLSVGDHPETNKENETLGPYDAPQPIYEEVNQENCLAYEELIGLVNIQTACSVDHFAEVNCINPLVAPITESVNSSLPIGNVVSEVIEIKESQTPWSVFSPIENSEVRSEKSSNNIWSRRGKPASALRLQTSRSRGNIKEADTITEAEFNNQGYAKDRSVAKALFSSSEEETFTLDKENYSPNTLSLKCLKKQSKLEEIRLSNSYCSPSPKHLFSPNIHLEENMSFSSDKENQTPKVFQPRKSERRASKNRSTLGQDMVLKEKRAERVPFQSLLPNSSGKSTSEFSAPTAATRSCLSVSCAQAMQKINSLGEAKGGWTMVVDTTSLLDKESRKSLQLLQGLKGTQLIIPRIVIRELDCLNRRGSLFRRTTEASLALGWIEECMLNTRSWIHVQSSIEEGERTAPTPPASPHSHFSEGNGGFPFWTTSSASFSPTSEDHIIDYALFNRRLYNNGLVLVSNDITLKIKAMAEGLICETAQEFRNSLVNPFSERFLWAYSSPRGQTWSVIDDVELKDKYYRSPSKKSSKGEGAKGLKLILLHNAQYGQNSWPVKTY